MYYALAMLVGENIDPQGSVERTYATFVIFYGACMNATLFGQVALLLQNQNSVYHRFQQELDSVNQNMRILNLPEDLQQRVRNYYDYWFHRHRLLDYRKFVSQLSNALGSEVCLYLHREMVQKVPLFRHCSADFLVALVKTLSHRVYMPGDFIVRYGEVREIGVGLRWRVVTRTVDMLGFRCLQFGYEMYFINSGECDIIAKNGCVAACVSVSVSVSVSVAVSVSCMVGHPHTKALCNMASVSVITVLKTGEYFGELALLSRERRTATVRAQGYCDLSILTRMSLDRLLDVYPEMEPAMKKVAASRVGEWKKTMMAAERANRVALKILGRTRTRLKLKKSVRSDNSVTPLQVRGRMGSSPRLVVA